MDEDTRNFLQHIHDSLERRIDSLTARMATHEEIEDLRASVATTEQLSALGTRVTQLRDSMLQYARHTEARP